MDLGCGTGLELHDYFKLNPSASVTGIDFAPGMLRSLKEKFKERNVVCIQGSYFDVPFGECVFDAAVTVGSLHHFSKKEKVKLYQKLKQTLRVQGFFILTDYFALTAEEEVRYVQDFTSEKRRKHRRSGILSL